MLTENKSMTGRREKDSGFCLRRAVRGSARVLAVAGDWQGTTKTLIPRRFIGEPGGGPPGRLVLTEIIWATGLVFMAAWL